SISFSSIARVTFFMKHLRFSIIQLVLILAIQELATINPHNKLTQDMWKRKWLFHYLLFESVAFYFYDIYDCIAIFEVRNPCFALDCELRQNRRRAGFLTRRLS
ncbi:MAG: hypothetical protein WCS96_09955, partial [Victivallales bacterium]